jgi:hypothetical protein
MEKQNEKLILDENINESIDLYKSPLIYRIINNLYNLVSVVLFFASLILLGQFYSDFGYNILEHSIYNNSITYNAILGLILFISFVAWIGLSILFYILNWVERGQLAKRKWVIFNIISGILAFYSILLIIKDYD